MNVGEIRRHFPILKLHPNVVYLDSAATSLKPDVVEQAITDYWHHYTANAHRSMHSWGEETTQHYEHARGAVAEFIGASNPAQIVFVRNATEALNLIAYTWGSGEIQSGDHILTTIMEHHSNYLPWLELAARNKATLDVCPLNPRFRLNLEAFDRFLEHRPKLVTITHASNVLGTINPVKRLIERAHRAGATVVVDAAQSVPHLPIDVAALDVDFLVFSGHKILAPSGIGVLYAKEKYLEQMPPFLYGGDMIDQVHQTYALWAAPPAKFEAGTPNIEGAIGLGEAVEFLGKVGMPQIAKHEADLTAYALQALARIPRLKLIGPAEPEERLGNLAFELTGIHPHDVATLLNSRGVAVRAGFHCAQPLHEALGVQSTIRASIYLYNTPEDIDALARSLKYAYQVFHPQHHQSGIRKSNNGRR